MSDTRYELFQHYGTNAERLAFTPSPAAGIQPIYIWYATDTGLTWVYDTSWHQINSAGGTIPATVQGDMLYASAANTIAVLAKTTARRSLVNTGTTNNPAWAGAQILPFDVALTNAEIIALPTTAKTLVAAPGAGFRVRLLSATLSVNNTAGLYTNVNATYASMQIQMSGGSWMALAIWNDSNVGLAEITTLLATAAAGRRAIDFQVPYVVGAVDTALTTGDASYISGGGQDVGTGGVFLVSNVENVALVIKMDNNGLGVLTGGNAANTGRVTGTYTIEALVA